MDDVNVVPAIYSSGGEGGAKGPPVPHLKALLAKERDWQKQFPLLNFVLLNPLNLLTVAYCTENASFSSSSFVL